ncbi:DUF4233 domain-containing protein [Corynebacterium ulceribovis]|uniref:DUF4233 domain-containing protein n=1 Tax=Corynebacterium ulceribovis TaxID=487732 RepID=UPI000380DF1E|nr:DUF4233 domain-containing protein [Corynebacterium ulceribovis]
MTQGDADNARFSSIEDELAAYRSGEDLSEGGKYGPLGKGHAPAKDPLKGLRGVLAGTLVLEAICILLVLTVISRVDEGASWSTFNMVYVTVLGVGMFVAAGFQGRKWAIPVDIALQVLAVGGFIVHPSMGVVGLVFAAVWAYILYLRKQLIERMEKGMLVTQHI